VIFTVAILYSLHQVNEEDFQDVSDDYANEILRGTSTSIRMLIYREEIPLKEDDIYDVFNLDMLKKPGKGLGLSIVSRAINQGIFISDIVRVKL